MAWNDNFFYTSQMLVTTPEKWDVVTRKSTGDVALTQIVKLLIIDEVHLLHDDRGSVIESLVARTLRQVTNAFRYYKLFSIFKQISPDMHSEELDKSDICPWEAKGLLSKYHFWPTPRNAYQVIFALKLNITFLSSYGVLIII